MNSNSIATARAEAVRFIDRVDILLNTLEKQKDDQWSSMNPKECGAVKRASMDLTRALAELRRPM